MRDGVVILKILPFQPIRRLENRREIVCQVLQSNLDSLYSTAYRLIGRADIAEDLVQETARKALQGLPTLRDERNVRAWLFRILINSLRDHLRRQWSWEELDAGNETLETMLDPEDLSMAAAFDVRQALSRLSPTRRALVILIDIEEFTIVEAAAMLHIPVGTVASRLARAHGELREFLRVYRSQSSQDRG